MTASSYYETPVTGIRYSSGYSTEELSRFFKAYNLDLKNNRDDAQRYWLGWVGMKWCDYLKNPYFKIGTLFAEKLVQLKNNIPGEFIAVPMPSFFIRMEKRHGIAALSFRNEQGDVFELESIQVACFQKGSSVETIHGPPFYSDPNQERCLSIISVCTGRRGAYWSVFLKPGCTPWFQEYSRGANDNIRLLSDAVMKLVIGVCCLATSNREWLTADVLSRDTEKYKRCQSKTERERIEQRAVSRGKRGWTVNPEIILPRDNQEHRNDGALSGKHLKYKHHRSSHLAMVRCGTNRKSAKLVIRKWCVVRPDLPDNPNHQKKYRAE